VVPDAAPQRDVDAAGRQHVGSAAGRRGHDQRRRREHVGGPAERLQPSRLPQRVDHRRERVHGQPHRQVGVAGYFGTPSISRTAWEADPAFIPWLRRLADAVSPSALSAGTPLATMVTRAGALDIAATTAAERTALGATADRYDASYPEPSMSVEAVVAVPGGIAVPDDVAAIATATLVDSGWDAAAADDESLPSASTMLALRTLWQEAT
jgi:hypothetical protein